MRIEDIEKIVSKERFFSKLLFLDTKVVNDTLNFSQNFKEELAFLLGNDGNSKLEREMVKLKKLYISEALLKELENLNTKSELEKFQNSFVFQWKEWETIRKHIRNVYKILKDSIHKLTQSVENDLDFSIILKEKCDNIDIILSNNDTKFSLSDWLPEGYYFKASNVYKSNNETKVVSFVKDDFNKKFFLLRLLHEIGHTYDEKGNNEIKKIVSQKIVAINQGLIKRLYYTIKHRNLFFLRNSQVLPVWYLDKFAKSKAMSEKNAWIITLKLIKFLQIKGFDIINNDIIKLINMSLLTYEISFINDRYLSGLSLSSRDINLFLDKSGTELIKDFITNMNNFDKKSFKIG